MKYIIVNYTFAGTVTICKLFSIKFDIVLIVHGDKLYNRTYEMSSIYNIIAASLYERMIHT